MCSQTSKPALNEGLSAVWSAFHSLLRLLRIPVPLACAICVAVMLGTSTVKVQSFELPRVLAAVASVIVLIAVYLGAYRAALVLLRLLEETIRSADPEQSVALCHRIRGESSLHNPFSSTQVSVLSESSITDYVPLVAIHLPMLVVLVCGFWALSEQRAQVPIALATLEKATAARGEMDAAGEDVASGRKAAQRVLKALDEGKESTRGLNLTFAYHCAATAFVLLYVGFLKRIAEVISIVNLDEAFKRKLILGASFVVLGLPFAILHCALMIQTIRFYVRLSSI